MKTKENHTLRKKSYGLLVIGAVLMIVCLIYAVYTHNTSYQQSVQAGTELKEVKAQIEAVEEGTATGDLEALQEQSTALSAQKADLEKPYSYGLAALFLAILLVLKGLYNALYGIPHSQKTDIKKLSQAGIFAALCYVGFAFLKFDIPIGGDTTAIHFGNAFCVLAALLLGGYWGGLAGAVGMTIGDLTTIYVTSAPKTFLLKLMIGLIVGFVAHNLFKLSADHDRKYVMKVTLFACICGMGFNIVADPLVGYFYKMYLFGIPQELSAAIAKISSLTTTFNAFTSVLIATVAYLALRPAMKKAGLFLELTADKGKK